MTQFNYTCLTKEGKEQKGLMEGGNRRQIKQELISRGLIPLSVELASQASSTSSAFNLGPRVNSQMLALLTRQLAILLAAATPLDEALLVIAKQINKPKLARMLFKIHANLMQGHSFAASLEEFPRVFSQSYRAAILAGEQSGYLEKVLHRLADYLDEQALIKQKIQQALIYPSVVCSISLLVVIFLLTTVVPKMVAVFIDAKQQLPWMTQVLIWLSAKLKSYGLLLLGLIVIAGFLLRRPLQRPHFKSRIQDSIIKLPLLGPLYQFTQVANFLRVMGNLLASSVPVLEALAIAGKVVTQLSLQQALQKVSHAVREGESLSKSLQQTGYFPPVCLYLIASGENSDQLETMLEKSAHYLETQIINRINTLLALFEPLMIVLMGGIVLFIVLAVLLPIFDLNELIA